MTLQQILYAVTVAETGSINRAANELLVSQSCLSTAIHEIEREFRITIFIRSNRGVVVTTEGEEFLGYARQMLEQYQFMQEKYVAHKSRKRKFSVSMQHYTFAVQAFIKTIAEYDADEYDFAVYETRTNTVIENVRNLRSEIGVLYEDDFNALYLEKIFKEAELRFNPLFECPISVFLWKGHPLASQKLIAVEELEKYPCLAFDQGNVSVLYAEEAMSSNQYAKTIRASDRATMLNLMKGVNGYTLCSGIVCEELNGSEYTSIRLDSDKKMRIGYLSKKQTRLSEIAEKYVSVLKKYGEFETRKGAIRAL